MTSIVRLAQTKSNAGVASEMLEVSKAIDEAPLDPAFSRAIVTESTSMSHAKISVAPSLAAAIARIPVPVPTSRKD